jgi:hypothetical protein
VTGVEQARSAMKSGNVIPDLYLLLNVLACSDPIQSTPGYLPYFHILPVPTQSSVNPDLPIFMVRPLPWLVAGCNELRNNPVSRRRMFTKTKLLRLALACAYVALYYLLHFISQSMISEFKSS